MPRALTAAAALLAPTLAAAPARADTRELSLRPFALLQRGDVDVPEEGTRAALAAGGGLLVGYGVSFSLTLTARYLYASTGPLSAPGDAPGVLRHWEQRRHQGLLGVAWAHGDQYAPVLHLEAGAAHEGTRGQYLSMSFDEGRRSLPDPPPDRTRLRPAARGTVSFEWRFDDFWGVAPGLYAEHVGAAGYGAQLWLAWYRYL